jgi:predicted MPP superfamily phosphohydrolase
MNNIKELLYYMIGRVPANLHESEISGKRLLHISDTPSAIFSELSRIIKILKPDYIVHTGDLVDNIKLELFPGSLSRYEKEAKKLLSIMEQPCVQKIYVALGNHDDAETLKKISKRIHIIKGSEIVHIEGAEFAIAHDPADILKSPASFNLFGHNLTQKSGFSEGRLYLNGITSINLVELDTMRYYSYPYPAETDNHRLRRGRIGL